MAVTCPRCKKLALSLPQERGVTSCNCGVGKIEYQRFPAFGRALETTRAQKVELDEEASCLHHPDKRAVAVCSDCGGFLCGLCHTADRGDDLCLTCYGDRQKHAMKKPDATGSARSVRWDIVTLTVTLVSFLFWYFIPISAPAVLYMVFRHWKSHPYGVVPHSRIRLVAAGLIALAQLVGMGILLLTFFVEGAEF